MSAAVAAVITCRVPDSEPHGPAAPHLFVDTFRGTGKFNPICMSNARVCLKFRLITGSADAASLTILVRNVCDRCHQETLSRLLSDSRLHSAASTARIQASTARSTAAQSGRYAGWCPRTSRRKCVPGAHPRSTRSWSTSLAAPAAAQHHIIHTRQHDTTSCLHP